MFKSEEYAVEHHAFGFSTFSDVSFPGEAVLVALLELAECGEIDIHLNLSSAKSASRHIATPARLRIFSDHFFALRFRSPRPQFSRGHFFFRFTLDGLRKYRGCS